MKINWLTLIKDWFGLIAVVLGLVSAVGFSVSAPWPARADVDAIQKSVEDMRQQMHDQQCLTLRVLLRSYQDALERAEDDLRKDPNSQSARRAKAESEGQITQLTESLRRQSCIL